MALYKRIKGGLKKLGHPRLSFTSGQSASLWISSSQHHCWTINTVIQFLSYQLQSFGPVGEFTWIMLTFHRTQSPTMHHLRLWVQEASALWFSLTASVTTNEIQGRFTRAVLSCLINAFQCTHTNLPQMWQSDIYNVNSLSWLRQLGLPKKTT